MHMPPSPFNRRRGCQHNKQHAGTGGVEGQAERMTALQHRLAWTPACRILIATVYILHPTPPKPHLGGWVGGWAGGRNTPMFANSSAQ
jgi:hypothetical protein